PAVAAGNQLSLTASGGTAPYTWSLAPGSAGSINTSTGEYTAPATVTVNHQAGGCQVYPSASVFSTKIDNLPVHASSAAWISAITPSTKRLVLAPGWGLNLVTSSTPTYTLSNLYTPIANGNYPILGFPWLKRQGGYYSHAQSGLDRHISNVNKESCEFTEMYNTYPAGLFPECPSCNASYSSQSAARYVGTNFKYQAGAGVDAAGLPLQPVTTKLADFNAGVIKHPMRFTLPNNIIKPSYIWPATANALAGGGAIPYGAWLRLKSSFNISGFSPKAQIVLQAWKDYGLYLADGGLTLEVSTDTDVSQDKDVFAAIGEISGLGPQIGTDFEFVDASSLMVSPSSTAVKHDNPYVTPVDFAYACVTDAAMNTACKYIALQGVTVGTTHTAMTFQAGAQAVQLDSWVHGSANQTVNWTMSPSIGTLTGAGLYTPPESVAAPTVTMFTGTAEADPNASIHIYVVVWPEGVIRVDTGRTTDYVGSEGIWFKEHGFDGGQGARTNEATNWPVQPDITLYHTNRYVYANDLQYRWWLSPGNYKITLKWGLWGNTSSAVYVNNGGNVPHNNWVMGIDTNGSVVRRRYDVGKGQGQFNKTHDIEIPCWVREADNGLCFLAIRQIADYTNDPNKAVCQAGGSTTAACAPGVNAIRIEPDTGGPRLEIDGDTTDITISKTRQLGCVGWFIPNTCSWSIASGPGTIDQNGLYTAPSVPPLGTQTVTILAVSTEDPSKTAELSFNFVFGNIVVSSSHTILSRGQSATFTASIGGVNYTNVTWSRSTVQGVIGSANGLYQAPSSILPDETITITATSLDDASKSGSKTLSLKQLIDPIRVNAGSVYAFQTFTDGLNRRWSLDSGATGGMVGNVPLTVVVTGNAGGADPEVTGMPIVYQSHRYAYKGNNSFSYAFLVPAGNYSVRLKFMPPAPVPYIENIIVENSTWRTNWDVTAASGGVNKAVDLSGTALVLDGTLNITIRSTPAGDALLCGIEIIDLGPLSGSATLNSGSVAGRAAMQ
ncbi:MAG: hypothetical protein JNK48_11025, partial [Bryobacterales bacterium]|nr:hypothetical protein [Bryobacterales bacterium]